MASYVAYEFDLARGERTGQEMVFVASDKKSAAISLVYTLNLKASGWKASPSCKTVQNSQGNIGWHIVKDGSFAHRMMT